MTGELTDGVVGRKVRFVDKSSEVLTVSVFELAAVWAGEDESLVVSVTMNEPALA